VRVADQVEGAVGHHLGGEGDHGEEIWIRAAALSLDGTTSVRRSGSGPRDDAIAIARRLAAEMLQDGAAELIKNTPEPPAASHEPETRRQP
jgi:hydroxymethylbilane synthase